jgi:TonB family protein
MLPLIKIKLSSQYLGTDYYFLLDTITISSENISNSVLNNYSFLQISGIIYLIGAFFFTVRFLFRIGQITLLILKTGVANEEGFKIIYTTISYAPFSFFNYIFINKQDRHRKSNVIYIHEKAHIKQLHSLDLLILEMASIFLWFNPVIWLYKIELKNIHEFQADQAVIDKGYNVINYQQILLEKNLGNQFLFTNNFNHSLIKRRFIMMTKSNSSKYSFLKMIFIMPISVLLLILFSISITNNVVSQEAVKSTKETKTVKGEDEIFMEVEKMPEYPGGKQALIKFLVSNIKYPESARKEGADGTVYVAFVVEKDGKITNVKVKKGFHPDCDAEGVRVVSMMPDWVPGTDKGKPVRVKFTLPIKFNLDEKTKKSAKESEAKEDKN